MKFYCLKEKKYVEVPASQVKITDLGVRRQAKATCPSCGSGLSKFLPAKK